MKVENEKDFKVSLLKLSTKNNADFKQYGTKDFTHKNVLDG